VLTPICLIAAGVAVVVLHGRHVLNQAFAEADQLDPGWRWSDLDARREVIPDAENSALAVYALLSKQSKQPKQSGPSSPVPPGFKDISRYSPYEIMQVYEYSFRYLEPV